MKELNIYIDRLKNDQVLKIDETLPPDFLDIAEQDLAFKEPVHILGEAYLADDHLVMHLTIQTTATLPCSICNEIITTPIHIKNAYLTQPLEEIKGAVYDLTEEVREVILLQTPPFIECCGGKCPEREAVKKFFKTTQPATQEEKSNFPFSGLE